MFIFQYNEWKRIEHFIEQLPPNKSEQSNCLEIFLAQNSVIFAHLSTTHWHCLALKTAMERREGKEKYTGISGWFPCERMSLYCAQFLLNYIAFYIKLRIKLNAGSFNIFQKACANGAVCTCIEPSPLLPPPPVCWAGNVGVRCFMGLKMADTVCVFFLNGQVYSGYIGEKRSAHRSLVENTLDIQ